MGVFLLPSCEGYFYRLPFAARNTSPLFCGVLSLLVLLRCVRRESTVLGRSSRTCDVTLDAAPTKTISRKHAEIFCGNGRRGPKTYTLRDLGSTNGVFVNEFKVQEQRLRHGDVVQFGGAADIPVGTRFGGTGSRIRCSARSPTPNSKRRRGPNPDAPATNRPKIVRADTLDAADTLRAIGNGSSVTRRIGPDKARAGGGGDAAGGGSVQGTGGAGGVVDSGGGETPSMVMEVLRDAMCGLCSELLLDAAVLPCSHSFCRLCWAGHVEEKGTTCPVCLRKMHSSERTPRRCSNLDLLITSIIHKLAGPQERARWTARQEEALKRATAAARKARQQGSNNGPAAAGTRKAGQVPSSAAESKPSPARGVRSTGSKSNNNGVFPPEGTSRGDGNLGGTGIKRLAPSGTADGNGNSTVAAPERCEGCDEEGHEFRECPHRSDSALDESEEEEDEEDEEEEEDEDEEDESSDDG
ncbi:unnamed protein product [Ectocarpus sp. CCAP 1310/34]|nr:unnamed protein product [Ectocarpus sp. CCAP 1310/34]